MAVLWAFGTGFCDDAGFGCLGPAMIALFVTPPVTALLIILVLSWLGVPRAFLVGLLALVSLIALSYALIAVLVTVSTGSLLLDRRARDQDTVDRLAETGAPAFVLDDPEWLFVAATPGDGGFS